MTEDYERIPKLDAMYLLEKEMEIEEQWQQWCEWEEEQERLPAVVEINYIHKKVKRHDEVNKLF